MASATFDNSNKALRKMQSCVEQLKIPLVVCWTPDKTQSIHGEIKEKFLFIYDQNESEAWNTFAHEICEYKLQSVTRPYRLLVNSLIEVIEKSVYAQKEEFIESMPKLLDVIRKSKSD